MWQQSRQNRSAQWEWEIWRAIGQLDAIMEAVWYWHSLCHTQTLPQGLYSIICIIKVFFSSEYFSKRLCNRAATDLTVFLMRITTRLHRLSCERACKCVAHAHTRKTCIITVPGLTDMCLCSCFWWNKLSLMRLWTTWFWYSLCHLYCLLVWGKLLLKCNHYILLVPVIWK